MNPLSTDPITLEQVGELLTYARQEVLHRIAVARDERDDNAVLQNLSILFFVDECSAGVLAGVTSFRSGDEEHLREALAAGLRESWRKGGSE